jgi:hypothetical protein
VLIIADLTAVEQGVHSLADIAGSESQAGGSHSIRSDLNFWVPQVETRNGAYLGAREQLHGLTEYSTSELYEACQIWTGNVHINGPARANTAAEKTALIGCGIKTRDLFELVLENWNQVSGFEGILSGGTGEHYATKSDIEEVADSRFSVFDTPVFLPVGFQFFDNNITDLVEFFQIIARWWQEKAENKITIALGKILGRGG